MLSRKKSNASAHLRHTHSASSVGSSYRRSPVKFEPVDPQVSHQQAVAAATLAYKRSFDRNSGPRDESDGIQRRPSTVNSDSAQKPILPRKQSVRFVTSAASSHHRSQADDFDTRKYRLSTDSSVRSDTRARSRTVTGSYSSSTMVASELEQQYLPQSTVASAPSSYRRLQKSKSMSNTRQATSEAFEGLKRGRSMRSSGTGERPSPKRNILKKPKSMSFLRERFASNSILDRQNQDAAVQMARENYTQQTESQKNTDSSSTTGSRARRQSKGFRKSLRSTSISSYGDAIASPAAQANFRPKYSFAAKARDFSASLKYRIKCAFNRSENRSDNPHQDHSGEEEEEGIRSGTGIEKPGIEVAPSPDPSSHEVELSSPREGYSASLKSRLPSDLVEPSKKSRSAVGSIRGDYVESDSLNDRSRVTSWTNSTPAATIGPRGRENMRSMSVIREDGSLFDQPWADNDDEVGPKTYAAFNQPMPGTDHSIPQEPVDSHRVYSALRRKLGDEESSHDLKSVPRASAGSVQSNHSSNTIRQEHSAWDSASRAPIERFSASGEPESQRFSYARSPTPPLDVQRAPFVNPDESGLHAPKPSPELLRLNENHSRADTTSVEDLSASIRSRAAPIIRQKQSGFSQYAAQDYLDEIANIPIMNEDSPSQDKGLRRGSQYSPSKTPPGSVFDSRATAEHWPHDVDGSLALPRQIVDESYRVPAMPNEPSDPAPRTTSNMFSDSIGSSVEWQTELSARSSPRLNDAHGNTLRSRQVVFGHRRERSQINNDPSPNSAYGSVNATYPLVERHGNISSQSQNIKPVSLFELFSKRSETGTGFESHREIQKTSRDPASLCSSGDVFSSPLGTEASIFASYLQSQGDRSESPEIPRMGVSKAEDVFEPSQTWPDLDSQSPVAMTPKSSGTPAPTRSSRLRGSPERARKLAANRPAPHSNQARGVYKNYHYGRQDKENLTPSPRERRHLPEKADRVNDEDNSNPTASSSNHRTVAEIIFGRRQSETRDASGANAFL